MSILNWFKQHAAKRAHASQPSKRNYEDWFGKDATKRPDVLAPSQAPNTPMTPIVTKEMKVEDIQTTLKRLPITRDFTSLTLAEGRDPKNGPCRVTSNNCDPYTSLEIAGVLWRKIRNSSKPRDISLAFSELGTVLLCRESETHGDGSGTTCRDAKVLRTSDDTFKACYVQHNPTWFACGPLKGQVEPLPPEAFHAPPPGQAEAVVAFHTGKILAALDPLVPAPKPDWSDLEVSARRLGEIGKSAGSAVPALIKALGHDHAAVRQAAAGALGQIGPEASSAIPVLVQILKNRAPSDRHILISIIHSLAAFGTEAKPAVPVLTQLLKNDPSAPRATIREALGKIDPEALDAERAETNLRRKAALEKSSKLTSSFMSCDLCGNKLNQTQSGLFAQDAAVVSPTGQRFDANSFFQTPQHLGREFDGNVCTTCETLICRACQAAEGSECPICGNSQLKVAFESIVQEHLPHKLGT